MTDPVWCPLQLYCSFGGGPEGGTGAAQEPLELCDADSAVQLSFCPAEAPIHVLQPGCSLLKPREFTGRDRRQDSSLPQSESAAVTGDHTLLS